MNINFGPNELVSTLKEIVGFKAGLAVSASRLDEIMAAAPDDILSYWPTPPSSPTRIRAEDFQAMVSWLLFRVGALPSHMPPAHDRLMAEQAAAPPHLQPVYGLVMATMFGHIRDQTLARVAAGKNPSRTLSRLR